MKKPNRAAVTARIVAAQFSPTPLSAAAYRKAIRATWKAAADYAQKQRKPPLPKGELAIVLIATGLSMLAECVGKEPAAACVALMAIEMNGPRDLQRQIRAQMKRGNSLLRSGAKK